MFWAKNLAKTEIPEAKKPETGHKNNVFWPEILRRGDVNRMETASKPEKISENIKTNADSDRAAQWDGGGYRLLPG